jgi:hypothetical protein
MRKAKRRIRGPVMLEDLLNTTVLGRTENDDEYREIAMGNVERHLGDVDPTPDAIYDEAYTLAFDALHDAGVEDATARRIADEVARCFAQP